MAFTKEVQEKGNAKKQFWAQHHAVATEKGFRYAYLCEAGQFGFACRHLNASGAKTQRGKAFTVVQVQRMYKHLCATNAYKPLAAEPCLTRAA